jgi:hypothetical protein
VPDVAELHFTEHDVSDQGSLALFVEGRSHCGIYWIDFADGSSYVGQSVNARSRLATHRRRWADAVVVRFAECQMERLDELELAAVQYVQKSRPLRNILLTSRPGGLGDLTVTVREGVPLALPWERENRGRLAVREGIALDDVQVTDAWRRLSAKAVYPDLVSVLHHIASEAMPSPVESQGVLWTLTALPATNRSAGWQRLFTLSAGRLELLRVFEDTRAGVAQFRWYLNLHPEADETRVKVALRRTHATDGYVERVEYNAVKEPIITVNATGLGSLKALLANPYILDELYRLVVSLMRQGINPLRRNHNARFALDVFAGSPSEPQG